MEETLITTPTAKLAKEKGFILDNNKTSFTVYTTNKKTTSTSLLKRLYTNYKEDYLLNDLYYCFPTQSLLQKWLREVHNIIITIDWEGSEGFYYKINFDSYYDVAGKNNKTYEECLEIALFKALKLIK